MGDPTGWQVRLKYLWWKWETPLEKAFCLLAGIYLIAMLLQGCSTVPQDLQAHEEKHCEGWEHTGKAPFYEWRKTRPASAKPWIYSRVNDPDTTCRLLGSVSQASIGGCAIWKPKGCEIYLPKH